MKTNKILLTILMFLVTIILFTIVPNKVFAAIPEGMSQEFKNILIVENNYKSIFSYILSKNYGFKEKNYLNPSNFDNDKEKTRQINDLLRKVKRQCRVNGNNMVRQAIIWIIMDTFLYG